MYAGARKLSCPARQRPTHDNCSHDDTASLVFLGPDGRRVFFLFLFFFKTENYLDLPAAPAVPAS